ncbi:MAG: hypothetical protein AAGH15_23870, partial [Myxococcota bacterium]
NPAAPHVRSNDGRHPIAPRTPRPGKLRAAALPMPRAAATRGLRAEVGRLAGVLRGPATHRYGHHDPTARTSPNTRVDPRQAEEALRWLGAAMNASRGRAELRRDRDRGTNTYRLRQAVDVDSPDDTLALSAACQAGDRAQATARLHAERDSVEVRVMLPSDGDAVNPARPAIGWSAP